MLSSSIVNYLWIILVLMLLLNIIKYSNQKIKLPDGTYIDNRRNSLTTSSFLLIYCLVVLLSFVAYVSWAGFVILSSLIAVTLLYRIIKAMMYGWIGYLANPAEY